MTPALRWAPAAVLAVGAVLATVGVKAQRALPLRFLRAGEQTFFELREQSSGWRLRRSHARKGSQQTHKPLQRQVRLRIAENIAISRLALFRRQ